MVLKSFKPYAPYFFVAFFVFSQLGFLWGKILIPLWVDLFFVILGTLYYFQKSKFRIKRNSLIPFVILSLIPGFAIHKLLLGAPIEVPFNMKDPVFLIYLLLLAPVVEELTFRLILWDSFSDMKLKGNQVLGLTTAIFALNHLMGFWFVNSSGRPFVLVQTLYVILLGLVAGKIRLKSSSVLGPLVIHLAFNLGFYIASVI